MGIKLNAASGGGSVELDVPNTVGSDITLTLPATDGTANQVLQTNGSGTLDWTDTVVLQTAQDTNSTYTTSNSTAYVSCGASVSINTKRANTKCLVQAYTNMHSAVGNSGRGKLRLQRTVGGTTTTIVEAAEALVDYGNSGIHVQGVGFNFLDTHGSGSTGTQVTYVLEFACNGTNGPVAVNGNGITLITVMEVDG